MSAEAPTSGFGALHWNASRRLVAFCSGRPSDPRLDDPNGIDVLHLSIVPPDRPTYDRCSLPQRLTAQNAGRLLQKFQKAQADMQFALLQWVRALRETSSAIKEAELATPRLPDSRSFPALLPSAAEMASQPTPSPALSIAKAKLAAAKTVRDRDVAAQGIAMAAYRVAAEAASMLVPVAAHYRLMHGTAFATAARCLRDMARHVEAGTIDAWPGPPAVMGSPLTDELRMAVAELQARIDEAQGGGDGAVGKRRGRLPKDESDARKAAMMAYLVKHPSMKDDLPALAREVGADRKTVESWLQEMERQYREGPPMPTQKRRK